MHVPHRAACGAMFQTVHALSGRPRMRDRDHGACAMVNHNWMIVESRPLDSVRKSIRTGGVHGDTKSPSRSLRKGESK